jgi:NAD(P)-dependent dehydrogenase (short-subunit alcohol dehydrogenase family)
MNKVWLVTGGASGLGRNIAEAVLESGDRLVATARDTKRLDDLVKKYGDRVRAVPLDVTELLHYGRSKLGSRNDSALGTGTSEIHS